MSIYKIRSNPDGHRFISRTDDNGQIWSIPFDPANTDYANFKREINEGTAQLEDADGSLMTAEQAKDFVKELP